MSGKRVKPSPWRFLRAAPVVVIAVVVWVLVGLFLLLPGSGSDQAHDGGVDPTPSSSVDELPTETSSSPADSPDASTPDTEAPPHPTVDPEDAPSSKQVPSPDLALSGASTTRPPPEPAPRPTSDPTSPAPTQPASGHGPDDNPGKKKGHDKPHGPPRNQP
jgi:periplasmic protein TonB